MRQPEHAAVSFAKFVPTATEEIDTFKKADSHCRRPQRAAVSLSLGAECHCGVSRILEPSKYRDALPVSRLVTDSLRPANTIMSSSSIRISCRRWCRSRKSNPAAVFESDLRAMAAEFATRRKSGKKKSVPFDDVDEFKFEPSAGGFSMPSCRS